MTTSSTNPIIGGELSFNSNLTSLTSNGAPDSTRMTTEANWRRQMIDGMGQVYTPFAQLRGDVYDVSNFDNPKTNSSEDGSSVRGNAVAGLEYRYPFLATTGNVAHIVEPIGQIIARPNSIGNQQAIPNEDANSLVFDDTLLFDIDKFSGYDRIETGTRANVGVRYTAQFYSGAYARAVFGESYQLAGENEFALSSTSSSGLSTDRSDYVGGLYIQANDNLSFSAQTRFDQKTWDIRRTDLGSSAKYGPVTMAVNYADVTNAAGLGLNQDRAGDFDQGHARAHRAVGAARQHSLRPRSVPDDRRRRGPTVPKRLSDLGPHLRGDLHQRSRHQARSALPRKLHAEISRQLPVRDRCLRTSRTVSDALGSGSDG